MPSCCLRWLAPYYWDYRYYGTLRLRRSCLLGLPTPFEFGNGGGPWWSALSLLLTIHGAIWWTTDAVEHQGAVGSQRNVYNYAV
eukprot:4311103-Pyramimonas_sp.AAC.1